MVLHIKKEIRCDKCAVSGTYEIKMSGISLIYAALEFECPVCGRSLRAEVKE